MPHYDAIVIGTGGVGSAALMHLALRGAKVLGLDRFPPAHDRGSSHGQTRIIRQAYFEHVDYVPLLLRAYALWEELEQRVGEQLYFPVGLVEAGPESGVVVAGVLAAAARHNLPIERLTPGEVHARWPGLSVPDDFAAVFEPRAGYLLVEACVRAHLSAAEGAGAELRTGIAVQSWQPDGSGVAVQTDAGRFSADRLVIAAGAWAGDLVSQLGVRLTVRRKPLFWYEADPRRYGPPASFPTFFYELPGGTFYGFPQIDEHGLKVAEHSGGNAVTDPLTVDRAVHAADQQRVEAFLTQHLPGVSRRLTGHAVCLYTMSPDEHFIVDRHPDFPQVSFAAGLSGHGFKFTTVLGEALAGLSLDGRTNAPIGFLTLRRFA